MPDDLVPEFILRSIGLLLIAAGLAASGNLRATDVAECGRGLVEFEASIATAADLRLACEAISDGVEFLRARGMDADLSLRVKIVDEFPSQHGIDAWGQFDPKRREIRVLSLAICLAASVGNPPFGSPMTADIYRSFIVHEVVHAVTHVSLAGRTLRRLDLEYLAYVAQLASLPDDVRVQLIAASGVEGIRRDDEINEFVYFADPNRFAIMSYLHYRRPENGDAYLRRIFGR